MSIKIVKYHFLNGHQVPTRFSKTPLFIKIQKLLDSLEIGGIAKLLGVQTN